MKNKAFVTTALCVLMLSALPLGAVRAQDQYVQQLLTQLEVAAHPLASMGYSGILGDGGVLENQTYEDYTVTLSAGSDYAILGVCDEDCFDLDLALFDGAGNVVVVDESEDDAPLVEFTVSRGGDFTLRVTMFACSAEPCYYGVGVYER